MLNLPMQKPFLALTLSLTFTTTAMAGDYADRPEAMAIIESAVAAGVDRRWAEQVMGEAQRQQSILKAISP